MPNIDSTIKIHNSGLINNHVAGRTCNCRKNDTCPVDGRCLEEGIVYESTIKSGQEIKKYVLCVCIFVYIIFVFVYVYCIFICNYILYCLISFLFVGVQRYCGPLLASFHVLHPSKVYKV